LYTLQIHILYSLHSIQRHVSNLLVHLQTLNSSNYAITTMVKVTCMCDDAYLVVCKWTSVSSTLIHIFQTRSLQFFTLQVNLDICVFDQCDFLLIRSQTFIPFLYTYPLKFRIVRPIMKQKIFNNAKKRRPNTVASKQCCQIVLLPRHFAAISSVSLRPPSKAEVSKQCLPITVFHPK
jgi:hypothetical protein